MEQISRGNKFAPAKRREIKDLRRHPKKKSRKSAFENEVAKIGMKKLTKASGLKSLQATKRKAIIKESDRLTMKHGMYANSYSKDLNKAAIEQFSYKIQHNQEYQARINDDLSSIIGLSEKRPAANSSKQSTIAPYNPYSKSSRSNKESYKLDSLDQLFGNSLTPTTSTSNTRKGKPRSSKVSFYKKESNESRQNFDESFINDLINNSIKSGDPICSTHTYIELNGDKVEQNDKEIHATFNTSIQSRFKHFNRTIKECAKPHLYSKPNLLDNIKDKLKHLHINCLQSNIETSSYSHKSSRDSDSREHFHFCPEYVKSQNDTLYYSKSNPLFNFQIDSDKESDPNYLNISLPKPMKNYHPKRKENAFEDCFSDRQFVNDISADLSPDIEQIIQCKKFDLDQALETPEFHYPKMNV